VIYILPQGVILFLGLKTSKDRKAPLFSAKIKNMSIQNFLIGLVLTIYGVITLQYNYRYTNMFSRSAFIETWFGSMYTFTKLTSILACIIGLLIMVGLEDNFANLITSPLRGTFSG
jgi:hypothetical protein